MAYQGRFCRNDNANGVGLSRLSFMLQCSMDASHPLGKALTEK